MRLRTLPAFILSLSSIVAVAATHENPPEFELRVAGDIEIDRVSMEAVVSWQYEPSEVIDGARVEQTAMVPIVFELSEGPNPRSSEGRWKAYVPGPITPAPWIDAGMTVTDADAIAEGEIRSLSSRFRLKDDIAGAVL